MMLQSSNFTHPANLSPNYRHPLSMDPGLPTQLWPQNTKCKYDGKVRRGRKKCSFVSSAVNTKSFLVLRLEDPSVDPENTKIEEDLGGPRWTLDGPDAKA